MLFSSLAVFPPAIIFAFAEFLKESKITYEYIYRSAIPVAIINVMVTYIRMHEMCGFHCAITLYIFMA